jgi:hypothetical protein
MNVVKLDLLTGDVLWDHIFSHINDPVLTLPLRTSAQSLIETHIGGQPGYRVVGYGWPVGATNDNTNRVVVADLDANGLLNWTQYHDPIPAAAQSDFGQCRALHICRTPPSVGEYYAITGLRKAIDHTGTFQFSAFAWVLDNTSTLFFKDTYESQSYFRLADHDQFHPTGQRFCALVRR